MEHPTSESGMGPWMNPSLASAGWTMTRSASNAATVTAASSIKRRVPSMVMVFPIAPPR